MKACELCDYGARMFCESDQASLCWTCDEKVHGANFLVAKHTRTLLCHVCQAPSPWKASGPKLTPSLSVCERCVDTKNQNQPHQDEEIEVGVRTEEEEDYHDEFTDDEEDEEEEEGENQVVPWSTAAEVTAPPPAASSSSSSSSSEERDQNHQISGFERRVVKRTRHSDLDSEDELECCSAHSTEEPNCLGSSRPLKQQRRDDEAESSRSTTIINSLKRLQNQMITDDDQQVSETIIEICNLTRDRNNF